MLKKLRWRVIIAAMIAFFSVMFSIVALINMGNYLIVTKNANQTLNELVGLARAYDGKEKSEAFPQPFFPMAPDPESSYMTRFFTVYFDTDGQIKFISTDFIDSVDNQTAADYANQVLKGKRTTGYFEKYRYQIVDYENGTIIIFYNVSQDIRFMKTLLWISVSVAAGSLLIVFILVYFLSAKAIQPYVNHIERQKRFVTDASHELKTPLTSISTSLDVIVLSYGEDEWSRNIRRQTEKMSKLVSELVTLSRLSEEIPIPNKELFSLSDAVWETAEGFQTQARAVGKVLSVSIEDRIVFTGDRASIQQMISVLLDNAIHYSNANSEIRLDVRRKNGKIRIEVLNDCSFEQPVNVERLFDRFYRPDDARSAETGGTGIGLAIARAAAEAHGGNIRAFCPNGKTISFVVMI